MKGQSKSDWAQAKADGLYAEARAVEAAVPVNGNYAQRREEVRALRRLAGTWQARAARYRVDERRAA